MVACWKWMSSYKAILTTVNCQTSASQIFQCTSSSVVFICIISSLGRFFINDRDTSGLRGMVVKGHATIKTMREWWSFFGLSSFWRFYCALWVLSFTWDDLWFGVTVSLWVSTCPFTWDSCSHFWGSADSWAPAVVNRSNPWFMVLKFWWFWLRTKKKRNIWLEQDGGLLEWMSTYKANSDYCETSTSHIFQHEVAMSLL